MCAIFGIIGKHERQKAYEAFTLLSHRGADDEIVFENTDAFLGLYRLRITATDQDISSHYAKNNCTILFNGEIYNYQTLAEELNLFFTSEVALLHAAYQHWGDGFVSHLRGMFAIAIIEAHTVKLFRDPFGKKPLYFTYDEQRFIFSSEMKAIHTLLPWVFQKEDIPTYFSFQTILSPKTFDKHIFQVCAGEIVCFSLRDKSLSRAMHWCMLNKPVTIYSEDEALVLLQNALLNSVALRIPREVPFACLLSGGVDSSLVAAMVCEHEKIDTFCLGYEGYEKYDERAFAQRVASHIGSRHHEVILSKEDFFQTVDEVINGLDEPIADPAMIPLYFLMRQLKKEGFKVVLTGDGSDELFMGYRTYKELYALESLKSFEFKGWMQRYLKSNFSMHKEWEWYKRVFESTLLFRSTAELFTDLQQNRLLRMNVKDNHSTQALQEYVAMFEKSQRTSPIDWYSFLDIKITLGDLFLRKLDRMSMAHGIEARSPFLDKEVVAVAFSSDPKIRMGKTSKSLVKKVAQTYLPKEIVHRKKKGFNYPYIEWLYGSDELKVIDRVQEKMGLFHEEVLKEYLKKGEQGVLKQHIFAIYLLCKWIEKHILD